MFPARNFYSTKELAKFVNIVENLPQLLNGPSDYIALFMTLERYSTVVFKKIIKSTLNFSG